MASKILTTSPTERQWVYKNVVTRPRGGNMVLDFGLLNFKIIKPTHKWIFIACMSQVIIRQSLLMLRGLCPGVRCSVCGLWQETEAHKEEFMCIIYTQLNRNKWHTFSTHDNEEEDESLLSQSKDTSIHKTKLTIMITTLCRWLILLVLGWEIKVPCQSSCNTVYSKNFILMSERYKSQT